eukprot:ANDGO_04734.mRNA.1 hypothetical protein
MRSEEFLFLLTASANKTANVRIFSGRWYSGCNQIEESLARRMGCLVDVLQTSVNNGTLPCDPRSEYLLLYNVQKSAISSDWLTVDLLVRSQADSWDSQFHLRSDILVGRSLHVAIHADTLEVVNETEALLRMGLADDDGDIPMPQSSSPSNPGGPALPRPAVLGNLHHSSSPVTFLALKVPSGMMQLEDIFNGSHDVDVAEMLRQGRLGVFTVISDAYEHIFSSAAAPVEIKPKLSISSDLIAMTDKLSEPPTDCHGFILEAKGARQDVQRIVDHGVSKLASKVIELPPGKVTASTNESAVHSETNVTDQFKRLKSVYPEFQVPDRIPPSVELHGKAYDGQ